MTDYYPDSNNTGKTYHVVKGSMESLALNGFAIATLMDACIKLSNGKAFSQVGAVGVIIIFGGILQFIGGIYEFYHNRCISGGLFILFSLFWIMRLTLDSTLIPYWFINPVYLGEDTNNNRSITDSSHEPLAFNHFNGFFHLLFLVIILPYLLVQLRRKEWIMLTTVICVTVVLLLSAISGLYNLKNLRVAIGAFELIAALLAQFVATVDVFDLGGLSSWTKIIRFYGKSNSTRDAAL